MANHVKILGVLYTVFGALGILGAIVVLLVFGGLAGLAGAAPDPQARAALPLLGGIIGGVVCLVILLFSLPGLIAGIGLLQLRPWARVFGIVVAALNLLSVPFGTALGIYGLWTLLNRETEQLFVPPGPGY